MYLHDSAATYTLGAVPVAGCATSDALSGIGSEASIAVVRDLPGARADPRRRGHASRLLQVQVDPFAPHVGGRNWQLLRALAERLIVLANVLADGGSDLIEDLVRDADRALAGVIAVGAGVGNQAVEIIEDESRLPQLVEYP